METGAEALGMEEKTTAGVWDQRGPHGPRSGI